MKLAILVFLALGARGHQAQLARPAHSEIVASEIRGASVVGIPAFPSVDKHHAVAGIFDYAASIVKMKREFRAVFGWRGQHYVEVVASASAAILQIHAFVLKIGERFAALAGNRVDVERSRQLKNQYALTGDFRAQAKVRFCVQRSVGEYRCVDLVIKGAKAVGTRLGGGHVVRSPDVVKSLRARFFGLTQQHGLGALKIDNHVERPRRHAFNSGIKIGLRVSGEASKQDA